METSGSVGASDHHRIIPTARMVAYFRSFSDIPYAKESSKALGGEEATRQAYQDDFDLVTTVSGPLAEARYKCLNRWIGTHRNVLELAVGTSIERGLAVSEDPENVYIGTDLPEMIRESKAFFNSINTKTRVNHHLEEANVLSYDELSAATDHFGIKMDVVVINEGLWMYLTADEQAVCAANIRRILEKLGGEWVTPDINDLESTEKFFSSLGPEMRVATPRIKKRMTELTGRDLDMNYFPNRQEAVRFLHTLGFTVRLYPLVEDMNSVTSISSLWGERERELYEPALRQQLVWVMALR